jgi:hypothetical protein
LLGLLLAVIQSHSETSYRTSPGVCFSNAKPKTSPIILGIFCLIKTHPKTQDASQYPIWITVQKLKPKAVSVSWWSHSHQPQEANYFWKMQ